MPKKKEIILGVTASIAIYKSLDLLSQLKKKGFNLTVIMTKEAKQLIRPLSFQVISENPVYSGMFSPVEIRPQAEGKRIFARGSTPLRESGLSHISLAERASLVLICPATANIIGKLANGICDDLLTTTVISSPAPLIICPAMNEQMYKNGIVQENIKGLKSRGIKFVGPVRGKLACGRVGIGHLAPLSQIAEAVLRELK